MRSAPHTFDSQRSAERWLTLIEAEIVRGEWHAPEVGRVLLGDYATTWLAERKLEPRTRELYASLLRLHVQPFLGKLALGSVHPQTIRTWRANLLANGRSELTAAKAYRFLRAVLNTAVREDRLIRENPCRIPGYDKEPHPERPTATVDQAVRLAGQMPPRYRALVLTAAFAGLRWGELIALRASDLGPGQSTVRVSRKFAELQDGSRVIGRPKSEAGHRTLALPPVLAEIMGEHLADFPPDGPDGLLFVGPKGAPLRRNNFHRSVRWTESIAAAGLPEGFHFHDLRHTGNTLAAAAGASTRELMHRMGHGSMRAALIYQHATSARDRELAVALGERIRREMTAGGGGEPTTPEAGDGSANGPGMARALGEQPGKPPDPRATEA